MIRDNLVGKSVLVTGGAGFIGSHLCDEIYSFDIKELIIVDNLFLGSEENIQQLIENGAIFYKEDIEFKDSLDYIFDKHDIDVVFNLATKALNYSFVNPSNAFDTNVQGILNLLELQRKEHFKTLCHFSTSEVYGSAVYEPMDELHPRLPTTTYAAGKAAADMALESYVKMFNLDAFIVRPFNNYGPRQNHKGYMAGIIPITALRIFQGNKPEIHGTGLQSRDFIFVKDTVDAVIKLLPIMPAGESVNISTDNQISVNKLIGMIVKHYDYKGEILKLDSRAADVETHDASNKKIRGLIEYSLTPFSEGLGLTLDWYKDFFEKRYGQ
jgi:UDP-glucose 4-epimerase